MSTAERSQAGERLTSLRAGSVLPSSPPWQTHGDPAWHGGPKVSLVTSHREAGHCHQGALGGRDKRAHRQVCQLEMLLAASHQARQAGREPEPAGQDNPLLDSRPGGQRGERGWGLHTPTRAACRAE